MSNVAQDKYVTNKLLAVGQIFQHHNRSFQINARKVGQMIGAIRTIWMGVKERLFFRQYANRSERFNAIYERRMWQNPESASGFGSTLKATEQVRDALGKVIADYSVTSILDAPCGDFNWMRHLKADIDYTGLDIVPDLIAENQRRDGGDKRHFAVGDIVVDQLPPADMVMCRECLNHLPLADGAAAVRNLAKAARKLLVITHYPSITINEDQPASFRYRSLNLTLPPYGLREPDLLLDESGFEEGKFMAVWDVTRSDPFTH